MIVTSQKKKIIIFKLEVTKLERNLPFEIILPTGTKKVTSITITNSN